MTVYRGPWSRRLRACRVYRRRCTRTLDRSGEIEDGLATHGEVDRSVLVRTSQVCHPACQADPDLPMEPVAQGGSAGRY